MSDRNTNAGPQSLLHEVHAEGPHWIEIFKDRVAEDLKQVLQENMDWTTSLPILERLNRLHDLEEARRKLGEAQDGFRQAS